MFAYLFNCFGKAYNSSLIGSFCANIQNSLRNAWDDSFCGYTLADNSSDAAIENSATVRFLKHLKLPQMKKCPLYNALSQSLLLHILTRYEIFTLLLLFIAPLAPTMACAGVALLIIFGVFMRAVLGEPCLFKLNTTSFFVLLFMICIFVFSITSVAPIGSLKVWAIYAVFITMFFVVTQSVNTRERIFHAATILSTSGLIVAMYGVYQQYFGNNLGHAWIDEEMFTGIAIRVYSTLGNPNVLGEYLLLTIPVSMGLFWAICTSKISAESNKKRALQSIYFLGCAGVQMLCMILTQSRGCWLALALSALVFVVLVDKRFLAFFFIGLLSAPYLLPQSIIDRFASIGNLADSSTSYRVFIWLGTINMLSDFWMFGIGLGAAAWAKIYPFYSYSMIIAPHAHNIYLQAISEMGIVGFVVLMAVILAFCGQTLHSYVNSKNKNFEIILASSILAGVLGYMLQGAFDYVWYNYRVFLVFWMVLGLGVSSAVIGKEKQ